MRRFACMLMFAAASLYAEQTVDRDQLSQTLGHLLVRHLGNSAFELNLDKVVAGIQDEQNGIPSPMSEEEYEQAVLAISQELFEKTSQSNLEAAKEFLTKQAKEDGICVIEPERLIYRLEHNGQGKAVTEDSMPLIHYHGTLIDGTVFASSRESETPISLPLKHTIAGFAKGLVGMKEGEKRVLYIHPDLAYGVAGQLPPNSLLIFEVEIVKANSESEALAIESEAPSQPAS
ncbi:MAG: FKBP-type peptidyl-prolyl cis-trans isomerase [Verrucomicrobia bacterium]|nr:FKBP-type peptidyl-prolyl cis-trans isomerase [Verrucomicrobiota bacterium]MBS0647121.1 FKBP-type peptidyl-prolyl cis-trans isomerase [Verrucomicrobiota bacterium]